MVHKTGQSASIGAPTSASTTIKEKKSSLSRSKGSVAQRSNMTPKLGVVGAGQYASSNSTAKASTGAAAKKQSNFAIYSSQTQVMQPSQATLPS